MEKMDENNCLCKIVTSFTTYKSPYDKIRSGFFTYKEFLDENGGILKLNDALSLTTESDLFFFFIKCGAMLADWRTFLSKERVGLLKEALIRFPFEVNECPKFINRFFSIDTLVDYLIDKSMHDEASYFFDTYRSHFGPFEKMDVGQTQPSRSC